MQSVAQELDRFETVFDDESLVADAGLLLPALLWQRLGLAGLISQTVCLVGRVGGANPVDKLLTLVASMLVGGTHIDHVNRLRAGATQKVLGFTVAAPSTVGTFLRAFTWGHVRQLDKVLEQVLGRAWQTTAGPGDAPVVIDVDSTICEVHGNTKHGAAYGYTGKLGYHPLLAMLDGTGEIIHQRLRKGSSQKGVIRFVTETIGRARRAGATGPVTVRADSGFWSWKLVDKLNALDCRWSITMPINTAIRAAVERISATEWVPIGYTDSGQAEVADTTYLVTRAVNGQRRAVRLVVRRTRVLPDDPNEQELFTNWRYHAIITNIEHLDTVELDAFHRAHARVELAIRDLKAGSGMVHCPSGSFPANAAWLAAAVLAHNTTRWVARIGDLHPTDQLTVTATIRARTYTLAARVVNHARTLKLRLPKGWPWEDKFDHALDALQNMPALC